MQPFIGQIMQVGFNFPPRGWALCDGTLLPVSQNSALFSLLGTTFGGDGRTTFALPDLRGRISKHVGSGPGLNTVQWGQRGGGEQIQLTINHMPSHNHLVNASTLVGKAAASSNIPTGLYPGGDSTSNLYENTANTRMAESMIAKNGGSQPYDNRNPYLGIYHNIALVGIYPSRS